MSKHLNYEKVFQLKQAGESAKDLAKRYRTTAANIYNAISRYRKSLEDQTVTARPAIVARHPRHGIGLSKALLRQARKERAMLERRREEIDRTLDKLKGLE